MKMNRFLASSMGVLMTFGTLTGCSTSGSNSTPPSDKTTKISILNRVNPEVNIDNNPIIAEVGKRLNMEITFDAPPINNYNDKLQIVMASGDLPDIIYNWGGGDANYDKWASNGLLATIDDKIKNYPNLMENISSDMWENVRSTSTHQIHSVPKPNKINYLGYVINTDWLNKVNLKAPTTLDEYLAVCKAFTTQDPDGNGKADTYGISFTNSFLGNNSYWTNSAFLQTAFGIGNDIPDVDGQFKIREKFEGYIPFLKFIKQLNDDKVLDPEFVTNKGYADSDKLKEFRIGMIGKADGALQAPFTYHAPLKNDKGVSTYLVGEPIWGTWMISATANVDEALRLIDFGNSEEGFELMYLGTQGTYFNSYDPVSRFVDRTDDQTAALKTVSSSYISFAYAKDGKTAIVEYAPTQADVDRYHTELNNAISASSVINVPTIKAPLLTQLNSDIPDLVKKKDEQELKFVMGEISEDQFRDFLTKEYYPATDAAEKEYIQVATAAYANMKK